MTSAGLLLALLLCLWSTTTVHAHGYGVDCSVTVPATPIVGQPVTVNLRVNALEHNNHTDRSILLTTPTPFSYGEISRNIIIPDCTWWWYLMIWTS